MITRELPRAEWPRLAGTLLETAWPHFPSSAQVFVVEDGDRIVGTWALVMMPHVEGAWIAPEFRQRVSVGRRLLRAMRRAVRMMDVSEVLMMATSQDTANMCRRLGATTALDCQHFAVVMEKR